jgi:YHS domain-containing protein
MRIISPLCPTCGCSLVRLGINKKNAVTGVYKGALHYFCCEGCLAAFKEDSEKYIKEIADIAVCPTCLAEKHMESTVELELGDTTYNFCRCPDCFTEFKKNSDYYKKRLEGETNYPGIFGDSNAACC